MSGGAEESLQIQVQKHKPAELAVLVTYTGLLMGATIEAAPFRRANYRWMGALTRGQHFVFLLRRLFPNYAHAVGYIIGLIVHLLLAPSLNDAYCSTPEINSLRPCS